MTYQASEKHLRAELLETTKQRDKAWRERSDAYKEILRLEDELKLLRQHQGELFAVLDELQELIEQARKKAMFKKHILLDSKSGIY